MKKNERMLAIDIFLQCLQKKQPLSLLMPPKLSPFSKALCFGLARYYFRLEQIAEQLVDKRPKDLTVWLVILMGLLQIDAMQLPEYAVVQESVALLQSRKMIWAKGLVNAVLRRFCREKNQIKQSLADHVVFKFSHPIWLIEAIQKAWPLDWQTILSENNIHPPFSLRINLQKISREAYCERLNAMNLKSIDNSSPEADVPGLDLGTLRSSHELRSLDPAVKPRDVGDAYKILPFTDAGIILATPTPAEDLPGFSQGMISVQDGAAQLAGTLMALQPGLKVLDACCAPGGKLSHLLELEPKLDLLGVDIEPNRLLRVEENCHRLQINPKLMAGDAAQPHTWWDGQPFDRILLDAPCSALGIIRRHPDIKVLRTQEEIDQITLVQKQLLEALWPLLTPGGFFVYATCSIMPQENAEQIRDFCDKHRDAEIIHTDEAWGKWTGYGWQILPGEDTMDGFFYAKILKK